MNDIPRGSTDPSGEGGQPRIFEDMRAIAAERLAVSDNYLNIYTGDRFEFSGGAVRYRAEQPQAADGSVDYTLFHEDVQTGRQQRAEENAWGQLIEDAPDETRILEVIDGYDQWLETLRPVRYYPPADRLHVATTLATLGGWMRGNHVPFDAHGAIPTELRNRFLSINAEPHAFRDAVTTSLMGMRALGPIREPSGPRPSESRRRLAQAATTGVVARGMVVDTEYYQRMETIVGGRHILFDKDGASVEDFAGRSRAYANRPSRPARSKLEIDVTNLVTDTLALIAVEGGNNAAGLYRTLRAQSEAVEAVSKASELSVSSIVNIAKGVGENINAAGGVQLDPESTLTLDTTNLPADARSMPEAFRWLLYASLDLDASVADPDALAEELNLAERLDALTEYADACETPDTRQRTTRRVGKVAAQGAQRAAPTRGEVPRRPSGKRPYVASLYRPGHGRIS